MMIVFDLNHFMSYILKCGPDAAVLVTAYSLKQSFSNSNFT